MSDELKQNEKNGNFVQFYRDNMQAISKLAGKNPTAFQIFMFICEHMDGYNALMASYRFLKTIRVNLLGQLLGA